MTLRLLADQVLIRREATSNVSNGGVHLPERDVVRPLRGIVMALGPDASDHGVAVGDCVLHARYVGEAVVIDGAECLVVRVSDVLGVIQ